MYSTKQKLLVKGERGFVSWNTLYSHMVHLLCDREILLETCREIFIYGVVYIVHLYVNLEIPLVMFNSDFQTHNNAMSGIT